MKKINKLYIFGLIFVLAFTLLFSVVPDRSFAQTATSGRWINISYIEYDDEIWADPNLWSVTPNSGAYVDDGFKYYRDGVVGDCADYIGFPSIRALDDGKLYDKTSSIDGCTETISDINLDDINNSTIGFIKTDPNTIVSTGPADVQTYLRLANTADNTYTWTHGDCSDFLVIENNRISDIKKVLDQPFTCSDITNESHRLLTLGDSSNTPEGSGLDGGVSTASPLSAEAGNCEQNGGEFSWGICPLLRGISGGLLWVDEALIRTLSVPSDYYRDPNLENAWGSFRNIAYTILLIILLVMVTSTALGFEFVSAYTIKRAMPRFVMAVIFITLSYEICVLIIQIINEVSVGILGLITRSFGGAGDITLANLFNTGGVDGGFLIASLGVGAVAGGVFLFQGGAMMLAGMALVFIIIIALVFLLLLFRQILLVSLILMAPLAILSWIFPGNDKVWNLWKDSFWKLLLLFPLVMVLIGAGRGFATVVAGLGPDGNPNVLETVLKLVAYVGPYLLIPAMFKFAGGAFSSVAGMANSKQKGAFDRIKNRSGERRAVYKKLRDDSRTTKKQQRVFKGFDKSGARGILAKQGISEEIRYSALDAVQQQQQKAASVKMQNKFNSEAAKNGRKAALDMLKDYADGLNSADPQQKAEYGSVVKMLAGQKATSQLNSLQEKTVDDQNQTDLWNSALGDGETYGALGKVSPHYVADMPQDGKPHATPGELNAKRSEKLSTSANEALAGMKGEGWEQYAAHAEGGGLAGAQAALDRYNEILARGGPDANKLDPVARETLEGLIKTGGWKPPKPGTGGGPGAPTSPPPTGPGPGPGPIPPLPPPRPGP